MGFIDVIKERAKSSIKTIVLPETEDMRTLEAADKILKEGIAKLVLVGNEEAVKKSAAEGGFDISGAQIVDPATSEKTQGYIDKLVELRQKKGMTPEQAKEILLNQYLYYGVMMVKMGDADGMVSGACHSTADTLRPCLQILKTKPGTKLVSAFFLIIVPDCEYGANGAFVFGDSGLNQNPNPEELAAIAASSAESFKLLVQEEPIGAVANQEEQGEPKIVGFKDNQFYIFDAKDACYIMVDGRDLLLITENETYRIKHNMNYWEERLKHHDWFRCHRGYLVNLKCVKAFTPMFNSTYSIKLKNRAEEIPVSRSYVNEFKKILSL